MQREASLLESLDVDPATCSARKDAALGSTDGLGELGV